MTGDVVMGEFQIDEFFQISDFRRDLPGDTAVGEIEPLKIGEAKQGDGEWSGIEVVVTKQK